MSEPETVACRFRVKPSEEKPFLELLERHWPTLRALGLATETPPVHLRAEREDCIEILHIYDWRDADASQHAHEHPEVMAIWEPMEPLCHSMDFPHFRRLELGGT